MPTMREARIASILETIFYLEVTMRISAKITFLLVLFWVPAVSAITSTPSSTETVSGRVIDGFRLLDVENTTQDVQFTVYRGDYIKFTFDDSFKQPLLKIPALSIEQVLSDNPGDAPYFKMKSTGTYPFSLGPVTGEITVIAYRQSHYREVNSEEALKMIRNSKPLILDVRTPSEYKQGHLENSVLIPVQELQSRLKGLEAFKSRDILIYCATGNRSTVASKILIDSGFERIINLRHGIYEWYTKNYPIVR
jgi:rhodanese-related sulfurtransferase